MLLYFFYILSTCYLFGKYNVIWTLLWLMIYILNKNKQQIIFIISSTKFIIVILQKEYINRLNKIMLDLLNKTLNVILFLEERTFNFVTLENILVKCKNYLFNVMSKFTILSPWLKVYSILTKILNIKEKTNNKKNSMFLDKIKNIFDETKPINISTCQDDELDEELNVDIKSVRKTILKRIKHTKVKKILLVSKKN